MEHSGKLVSFRIGDAEFVVGEDSCDVVIRFSRGRRVATSSEPAIATVSLDSGRHYSSVQVEPETSKGGVAPDVQPSVADNIPRRIRKLEQHRASRVAEKTRLRRRNPEVIQHMIGNIVGLLECRPDGLRSEQIREELGWTPQEIVRPLSDAIRSGRVVVKSGQKRSTTYVVPAGDGAPVDGPT